jgi:hypothetical protein
MENRSVLPPRKKPPNVGGWPDSITRQDDRAKTALSALAEEFEANAKAIQAREAAAREIGLGGVFAGSHANYSGAGLRSWAAGKGARHTD